ncbi:MAG: diaminopimelate decarboxylase [Deltaproteobacteria bacterium]|jgi:diaminopimelate decarboxylase|nr:diaminopimelate decarboxylase [Deltaproteobacteria bacterium]
MDYFSYRDSELWVEGAPLRKIAEAVGTPAFVYSSAALRDNLAAYDKAFAQVPHLVCYSVKAASSLAILALVAKGGRGADVVSGGELYRALKAGVPAGKIVYSGVGKTAGEMAEALDAGIMLFNVESEPELDLLSRVARERSKKAPVAVRVNPDVDPGTHPYVATGLRESKFGLPPDAALALCLRASQDPALEVLGVDCHIGSQLTSAAPFAAAVERLAVLVGDLSARGVKLRYLDLGGGLGINYNGESPPTPAEYAAAVIKASDGLGLTLVLEPGRSVVGNACVMLTTVLYDKNVGGGRPRFVIVDGAMSDLLRPSLYGAYHGIVPVRKTGAPEIKVSVVGPVCESGDFLARDRPLQTVVPGDLLAVGSAGAYGFSMSSNYNSRTRAAEVLVDGGAFRVVRDRESYDDLTRGEHF